MSLIYRDGIPGGAHWSLTLKRGHSLTLEDLEGGANVGMLFYNPSNPLERYNAPDTLKCQHTFKLTRGHCLYSDMGRIFCSITEDDLDWHDTVSGNSTRNIVEARWGLKTYQEARNDWNLNGHDSFLVELAKYGLGRRDLAANVNWFSKVAPDDHGNLHYVTNYSQPGSRVTLRFEMDTLVVMHTCPHPLNPISDYPRKPIAYEIHKAAPVGNDDYCRNFRPENQRGFENNARYHLLNRGC